MAKREPEAHVKHKEEKAPKKMALKHKMAKAPMAKHHEEHSKHHKMHHKAK